MTKIEREENRCIWQQRIREMRSSGKTQAQWCEEHQISINTLRHWIKLFNREARQQEIPQWLKIQPEEDSRIAVLALPVPSEIPQSDEKTALVEDRIQEISIACGDITIRLPLTADVTQIAQIIAVLKAS